jgi:hypothetical protein
MRRIHAQLPCLLLPVLIKSQELTAPKFPLQFVLQVELEPVWENGAPISITKPYGNSNYRITDKLRKRHPLSCQ